MTEKARNENYQKKGQNAKNVRNNTQTKIMPRVNLLPKITRKNHNN